MATLTDMESIFGATRTAVIARELTKKFETIYANSLANVIEWLQADSNRQKGEFVILVHGATKPKTSPEAIRILEILVKEYFPAREQLKRR